MQERSFYTFCISACVFIIFISLSLNFVAMMGLFATGSSGSNMNLSEAEESATGQSSAFLELFKGNIMAAIASGATVFAVLVGAVGLAMFSGNWNIVAVTLFGVVFWGSWVSNLSIFSSMSLYNIPLVAFTITILSVGMLIMFIGATIGLLHLGEG